MLLSVFFKKIVITIFSHLSLEVGETKQLTISKAARRSLVVQLMHHHLCLPPPVP